MLLKNKIALVTGAARGIGRSIALIMATEGADVGVVDLLPEIQETAEEIRKLGRRTAPEIFNIANHLQVQTGIERIRDELGDIDVLVNNAGIVNNIARLLKMTHESWEREIAVNLTGAFNVVKEVIGSMARKKWGRVINISSLGGTGGLHNQIAYAASKAGIIGLTKTITLEHARDGITCNAIIPGLIGTELVYKMPEEIRDSAVSMIPARRVGQMEEVAHLAAFLGSEKASYINGAEIHIDGGMRLNVTSLGSRKELKDL